MIPFGNETVTVISRDERVDVATGKHYAQYTVYHAYRCSWRRTARTYLSETSRVFQEEVTCRIPAGVIKPKAGDLIIRGKVYEDIHSAKEYEAALERYRDCDGAFLVAAVSDNTRTGYPMPHYAARG